MYSHLEETTEATRAKTQSPTTTTPPSMTNPAGSTATIPVPLAPAKAVPAKLVPTHKPYMVNNSAAEYDPWNDEPPEEIVAEGVRLQQAEASSTWMSEWERAELNPPNNTAPTAEAKPPPAKVPAWLAVRSNNPMAKALGQPNVDAPPTAPPPPGQRPNSYYVVIHPNNPIILPVIGFNTAHLPKYIPQLWSQLAPLSQTNSARVVQTNPANFPFTSFAPDAAWAMNAQSAIDVCRLTPHESHTMASSSRRSSRSCADYFNTTEHHGRLHCGDLWPRVAPGSSIYSLCAG